MIETSEPEGVALRDLVDTSERVAEASARNEKVRLIAELLVRTPDHEVSIVVGFMSGRPRQGRIGVGWATIGDVTVAPATGSTLMVADLDELLEDLASMRGGGSQHGRRNRLAAFVERATAAEADFVKRLLIGELRQGANEGVVTSAVAKAAAVRVSAVRRAAMLTGDLAETAEIATRHGEEGLDAVGLELFRPVLPMLASTSPTPEEAVADLGTVAVEWKLDGIRVQVHRRGDVTRVWTRNLNEITDDVPFVVEAVRRLDAERMILDGEVLGIDESGHPIAFQDTVRSSTTSRPFFFDVLHHDGDDLLDAPLGDRFARLRSVAGSLAVPGAITDDPAEARDVFERAIADGHEGVVIKAVESRYQAGRRGKAWRKVKPVHTLDLVVLAVERGSGRRRRWLSNIHLGALDPETGEFVMVGKTFKGMTDEMLRWQTERFRELAREDMGRVLWLRPEQVVEIALDGVQRSTRYRGGAALRFARVVRYRNDKAPSEIDTIDTVRAMI